ncbi:MAG: hypothetical protein JW952_06600 [Candidatus Eisenbacteria bacterium]|nr:hypothetical protein [Candidatus Eisenbacteria bacterium]
MTPVSISLVAALVGFVASTLLKLVADPPTAQDKRRALGKAFLFGLLGAFAGHVTSTAFMSLRTLTRLEHLLDHPTPYDKAERFIADYPDPQARDLFVRGLRLLNHRLELLPAGQLLIDRDEVFNTWETLFRRAHNRVLATNLVAANDWEFFGPGGSGRTIQKDAISRGVRVVRIMLYDPKLRGHQQGLRRVACLHRAVGVEVRELPLQALENPTYTGWLEKLRTSDVVLYDNNYLLLTHTYERDHAIRWSLLTVQPTLREAASQFFDRLLQEATAVPACPQK